MAVSMELELSAEILDSMLLRIFGGDDVSQLPSLLSSFNKTSAQTRINGSTVSDRVQFVAHRPRGINGTAICTSLDGKTYSINDPNIPAVPQHFRCRSQHRFIGGILT